MWDLPPERRTLDFFVTGGFLTALYILALVSYKSAVGPPDGLISVIYTAAVHPYPGSAKFWFFIFLPAGLVTGLTPLVPKSYRCVLVKCVALVLAGLQVVYWAGRFLCTGFFINCLIGSPVERILKSVASILETGGNTFIVFIKGYYVCVVGALVLCLICLLDVAMVSCAAVQGAYLWKDIREQWAAAAAAAAGLPVSHPSTLGRSKPDAQNFIETDSGHELRTSFGVGHQ